MRNTVSVTKSEDKSNPVVSSYNLPANSSGGRNGAAAGGTTKSERRSSGFFGKMKEMRAKMKGGNTGGQVVGGGDGKEHVRPLIEFFEDEKSPDDSTWFFSGIVSSAFISLIPLKFCGP